MARVPVLVAGDAEVTDGVFSQCVWGECVFGFTLHSGPAVRSKVFERWAAAVCARATSRPVHD